MKKILSIALCVMMLATLFAVNAFAATGVYTQLTEDYLTEDFSGETSKFTNTTVTDGVATLLTSTGSQAVYARALVDVPSKFVLEFDAICPEGTEMTLVFADSDHTAEPRFTIYIIPGSYEAGKNYTYRFIIDQSALVRSDASENFAAIEYYRKEVGTDNWIQGVYDRTGVITDGFAQAADGSNITYSQGTPAIRYVQQSWLSNSIPDKSMAFYMYNSTAGLETYLDNVKLYRTYEELVKVTDYDVNEAFEGTEYSFSDVTVKDGVASIPNSASNSAVKPVASVDLPSKFVYEFDMECSDNTAEIYILFKDSDNTAEPYSSIMIVPKSFEANKMYTYRFIIDASKLVRSNAHENFAAIEYYRKEAGTDTWVQGVYDKSGVITDGFAQASDGSNIVYEAGTPAIRYLNSYASSIADKSVGFWLWSSNASTIKLDNVKVSKTGIVEVSEIVNDGETLGAKVAFDDRDSVDLSTNRSLFLATYNEGVLVDVDMEAVAAENGLYTSILSVGAADYDEAKLFVWETADNTPALPEVFDLTAWIAE